jgi:hypothetical protein
MLYNGHGCFYRIRGLIQVFHGVISRSGDAFKGHVLIFSHQEIRTGGARRHMQYIDYQYLDIYRVTGSPEFWRHSCSPVVILINQFSSILILKS